MAESGSYARGGQARSVPDTLAGPYAEMLAAQRSYNAKQATDIAARKSGPDRLRPVSAPVRTAPIAPLADRMYRPPADDLVELRRQQAAFQETKRAISRDNAWMAVPALAPVAVVAGLEAAGALAARLAPEAIKRAPFQFTKQDPYLRVGDNYATRGGRRAHAELKRRVEDKLNWKSDADLPLNNGRVVKPDVRTPLRMRPKGDEARAYQMELKPDTVTGRKAAAKAVKMYSSTGTKTRAIFYDPKKYR